MATRTPQFRSSVLNRHIDVPGGFTAAQLGEELKALFDQVAEEPLPDSLTKLADELEQRFANPATGFSRRSRLM
jgi:hypothetical protein